MNFLPSLQVSNQKYTFDELALRDEVLRFARVPERDFSPDLLPDSIRSATRRKLQIALTLALREEPTIASDLIRIGKSLPSTVMIRAGANRILQKEVPSRYDHTQKSEARLALADLQNDT